MNQQKQTIVKPKRKIPILCNECNKERTRLDESHQICHLCYKAKKLFKSGNKAIDDFIRYTQTNSTTITVSKFKFIPYDRFENVEFIAEGGFSKIYKATMTIDCWNEKKQSYYRRRKNDSVVLKKLNNSKNVTSKELNELKVSYEFSLKNSYINNNIYICKYFGITQDPITQDIMIIMSYYESGDLINYFRTNDFYSITWKNKLDSLQKIARGLQSIHGAKIVHRDLHSGNIFFQIKSKNNTEAVIGDLGISKSATESTDDDDNNENYGIIPYMAPEIFKGEKYTTASDIYSFGMIMWEFMTGRRPFWNRIHNADLIIEICDGLRPPIVTNAPEGYIELMKECWNSDPSKRPSTYDIVYCGRFNNICNKEREKPTKIIESPDIGPVTINNPGAIYKSRPLSGMIQSAMSTRSLRSQPINLETDSFNYYQKRNTFFNDKRKFEDYQSENSFNGKSIKKIKLIENENNDYVTKELEFDVDTNFEQCKNDSEYTTQEINFDII